MIKRVLFPGVLVLAAAYLGCAGDSGTGGTLSQKPTIVTDRDAIQADLCLGTGVAQSLFVMNKGVEDLVVSSLGITSTDPMVINSNPPAFRLLVNGLLDPNAAPGTINNTVKSNQSGLVSMYFNSVAAGTYSGTLTITSNAANTPSKQVPVRVYSPDAGTQGCP